MNYEEMYQNLQPAQKDLKDALALLQRLYKTVCKEAESGDVKSLLKDLNAMKDSAALLAGALGNLEETVSGFDARAYFESGDFTEQLLTACEEKGVDVQGEFPVYEMFRYNVRVDSENQDLYLDRKKVQCMRPGSFVDTVKAGQEKLNKAAFNALTFVNELSDAYDLALLKMDKKPGYDMYLKNLYKYLAPMSRFRKDYDQQSFAFDLARLYMSDIEETKSGRRFQFGPSRKQDKAIRILDKEGKEQFLATICFFAPAE